MRFLRVWRRWMGAVGRGAGGILPLAGGVLLALAVVFAAHSWWIARPLVRARATVTENVAAFGRNGGVLYYPRLRFRTAGGEIMLVLSRRGTGYIEWQPGKAVPVMYPKGKPQEAVIATSWRVYFVGWVLGIWGAAVFDVGWVVRRLRQGTGSSERSGSG